MRGSIGNRSKPSRNELHVVSDRGPNQWRRNVHSLRRALMHIQPLSHPRKFGWIGVQGRCLGTAIDVQLTGLRFHVTMPQTSRSWINAGVALQSPMEYNIHQ